MLFSNKVHAIALAALCVAACAASSQAADTPPKLTQSAIHNAYNEGDFEKVARELEAFLAVNKGFSRADSLFIAKHLAVVYTANSGTREKGKRFMVRLLELQPSAELDDMFVSEEIGRIFEKVRKDFYTERHLTLGGDTARTAQAKPAPARAPAVPAAAPAQAATAAPKHSEEFAAAPSSDPLWKRKAFWITGGAGVIIAGGLIAYIHIQEEGAGKTFVIPPATDQ